MEENKSSVRLYNRCIFWSNGGSSYPAYERGTLTVLRNERQAAVAESKEGYYFI